MREEPACILICLWNPHNCVKGQHMAKGRGTALVVDDAKDWRNELQEFLEDEGFEVITVGDKASALQVLDSGAISLAIIDVNLADEMQNMDGLLLNRYIREQALDIQVILISARTLGANDLEKIQPTIFIEKSRIWEKLYPFLSQ